MFLDIKLKVTLFTGSLPLEVCAYSLIREYRGFKERRRSVCKVSQKLRQGTSVAR